MENNFLDKKYPDLQNSKPVERAVKQTGENIYAKDEKIEVYLDRLEKLILDPKKEQTRANLSGGDSRPRALFLLREMVMNKYVRSDALKKTEGAVRIEERAARELGMNLEYGEGQRNERQEILVKDLEKSLDSWISYLSDNNEPYPNWFRYYVFRNVLNLGEFDKDKKEFKERSKGSAGLFPDIDRGALAYTEDILEATKDEKVLHKLQEAQKVAANNNLKEGELITKEKAESFSKMSFAKQYAEAIKLNGEITPEMREETRGKWVKYQQGTDPTALWASLQNKGTAWCTKGFGTASTQLKGGDFYVYYTLDKSGQPNIPRIAIRMNGQNQIGEVRGVSDNQQNLEGNMTPILEDKLKDFGNEADRYNKRSSNMKKMTELVKKQEKNEQFTSQDLKFLYEVDNSIEGFGYGVDKRIKELRDKRNLKEDTPVVFECSKDQVAYNLEEINENTKAYIGEWNLEIMKKISRKIEYLYESFPRKKIFRKNIELTTKTPEEYIENLNENKIQYSPSELSKIGTLKRNESIDLVKLSISQLGFPNGATLKEILDKVKEIGIELCPPQVAPELRLNYKDQPRGEWLYIAMEPLINNMDNRDESYFFALHTNEYGLYIDYCRYRLDSRYEGKNLFIFPLRKDSINKELSDAEKIKIKEKEIHDILENLFNAYDNGEQRVSLLLELLDPYLSGNLIEEKDEIKKSLLSCINLNNKNEFIDKVMEIVKPVLSFINNNPDIEKKFKDEQPKELKRKIFNTFNNFEQVGKYISYGIDNKTLHIHLPDADDLIKGKSRTVLFSEIESDFNNLAKIVDSNKQIKEIIASSWIVASKSNILKHFGFIIDHKDDSFDKEGRKSKYSSITRDKFLERYL